MRILSAILLLLFVSMVLGSRSDGVVKGKRLSIPEHGGKRLSIPEHGGKRIMDYPPRHGGK